MRILELMHTSVREACVSLSLSNTKLTGKSKKQLNSWYPATGH
jgi:hypothetical protein